MTKTNSRTLATALMVSAGLIAAPVQAKDEDDDAVDLATCTESVGTIAVVEGDTQGWSEYGLGSPRALIDTLARESGLYGTTTGSPKRRETSSSSHSQLQ